MVNYTEESAFIEKYKPFRKFWTVFSPHFVARLHSLANMIRGGNPTQEPPSNNEDFLTEYEACLKNWKDAQKIISSEIVFRLRDIKKLEVKKTSIIETRIKQRKKSVLMK